MSRDARRQPWHGALQILRFNWPDYGAALAVCAGCLLALAAP